MLWWLLVEIGSTGRISNPYVISSNGAVATCSKTNLMRTCEHQEKRPVQKLVKVKVKVPASRIHYLLTWGSSPQISLMRLPAQLSAGSPCNAKTTNHLALPLGGGVAGRALNFIKQTSSCTPFSQCESVLQLFPFFPVCRMQYPPDRFPFYAFPIFHFFSIILQTIFEISKLFMLRF